MIYAKFNEKGFISEFVEKEKEGYIKVENVNCRLINGKIIDETEKVLNQDKVRKLENWFDNYFTKQLQQSQWQKNFKVSPDPYFKDEKGNPRTYADIEELKAQAELVRVLINSLRNEV
jgi:hypothetical protein